MSEERVEHAIEVLTRKDHDLGMRARYAADALTAGEGEETISQANLQSWLWYYLPRKSDPRSWAQLVEGATALLTELNLERYAAIAASERTREILDAWRTGPGRGFARFKAAHAASGVEPPDTDTLAWGQIMGTHELDARTHVERALEAAIVAGRLKPGAAGSAAASAAVSEAALNEPVPSVPTQTWLTLTITERVESWVRSARPDGLRALRQEVANRLLNPPAPPADLDDAVAPLRWLLESCRGGVSLTQAGYLPTRLVADALDRFFGHERLYGSPRSEVDVHPLGTLREMAQRLRLIARRHRTLRTTAAGLKVLSDPMSMWRAVSDNLDEGDAYSRALSEMVAVVLLRGPAVGDALGDAVAQIVVAQGWSADGAPVTDVQARHSLHRPLWFWRLFGFLREEHARWEDGRAVGQRVTALTDTGQAAAWWLLRSRACAPRRDVGTY